MLESAIFSSIGLSETPTFNLVQFDRNYVLELEKPVHNQDPHRSRTSLRYSIDLNAVPGQQ